MKLEITPEAEVTIPAVMYTKEHEGISEEQNLITD